MGASIRGELEEAGQSRALGADLGPSRGAAEDFRFAASVDLARGLGGIDVGAEKGFFPCRDDPGARRLEDRTIGLCHRSCELAQFRRGTRARAYLCGGKGLAVA